MRILGVDLGIVIAGFGVVERRAGRTFLLDVGMVKMSSEQSIPERIFLLHEFFEAKVNQWQITDLSLEAPFLGKNANVFLKLGYVRGMLYLLVHRFGLRLHEFTPREVKRVLTGFGAAEKEQLARVIVRLFPGLPLPEKYDVTDAIALALCGLWKHN